MLEFFGLLLIIATVLTIIFVATSCYKLLDFYSVNGDGGQFFYYSIERKNDFKDARIIGKVVLIPVLLYLFAFETISAVLAVFILFFKGLFTYCLTKGMSIKGAMKYAFGYSRWYVIDTDEKLVTYSLMGYQWTKPYTINGVRL